MNQMRTETWYGYKIRFIEKNSEWWAVLKDLCDPLDVSTWGIKRRIPNDLISSEVVADKKGRKNHALIVKEQGIYMTIFASRKRIAKEFQRWVMDLLVELRKQTGLEGFEAFRMLDKEHQKEAMEKLKEGLKPTGRVSYIKANTIANKAVSNRHGFDKMVKKKDMTPGMLRDRQAILDDTVELMTVNEKFGLNLSVAEEVYKRWDA